MRKNVQELGGCNVRRISLVFMTIICAVAVVTGICRSEEVTIISADPQAKIAYNNPAWSPDGRSLAFVAIPYQEAPNDSTGGNTGKSIYLATPVGGSWKTKLVAKGADWPVWSFHGKQLAFNRHGLAIMTLSTGSVKVLMGDRYDAAKELISLRYPLSWSPLGRYLLCGDLREYGGLYADVLDLKKGGIVALKVGADAFWMSSSKLLSAIWTGTEAAPGGKLLISDYASGSSRALLDGRVSHSPFVPKGASYAWVWIAVNPPKGEGIYRVDLKTGALTKQTALHAKELYWSPDGKQFAFIADWSPRACVETLSCVYLGSTQNWQFKIVSKNAIKGADPSHTHLAWRPNGSSFAYVTADGSISVLKP